MRSLLIFILLSFAFIKSGMAQVIVNSDGSHSLITGNVVVNSDGTHSILNGNILVNPNGTHSLIPSVSILPGSVKLRNSKKWSQSNGFSQLFMKLFSKKDKVRSKQNKESRQRARGKISVKRFGNPR
ncbi:MAG: hypothetical protein WKF66_14740 [Pedobacter sp.]